VTQNKLRTPPVRAAMIAVIAAAVAACATAPPPDPATQMPALESRVFALINAQRHAIDPKAKDLALDSELVGLARERSADMAAKNAFATGDPHISATRLMAEDAQFQGLLGENVAAEHYVKARGIDLEQYAAQIVATWIGSPSHKENLSFADYSRTGVGAALSNDTIFITQLFATEIPPGPARKPDAHVDTLERPHSEKPPANGPALRGAMGNR
jgi:uncharacterized protein YkwD